MDEKMIPYFSHEGDMARMERANKRLFILLLVIPTILIIALVGTNAAWISYENSFGDKVEIEAEQETSEGSNYIVGGDFNGQAESKDN